MTGEFGHGSSNAGGPAVKVVGEVSYDYPCASEITVKAQATLDIQGIDLPSLDATLTIFCPGAPHRDGRAFDLVVSVSETARVTLGGQAVGIENFVLTVSGTDNPQMLSSTNKNATWLPMPDMQAVDIHGSAVGRFTTDLTISRCLVVSERCDGMGVTAETNFSETASIEAGGSMGLNMEFEKLAQKPLKVLSMDITAAMYVDYADEAGEVELHMTGEMTEGCVKYREGQEQSRAAQKALLGLVARTGPAFGRRVRGVTGSVRRRR